MSKKKFMLNTTREDESRYNKPCIPDVDKRNVSCRDTKTTGCTNLSYLYSGIDSIDRKGFGPLELVSKLCFKIFNPSFVALR